jgi:ABC-type Zn uptake system ZnuABC Zn-binding protein ZnuA
MGCFYRNILSVMSVVAFALTLVVGAEARAGALRVAATTPDLASIARSVGGDEVEVTSFVRGGQDPHFVEPRPSFIRELSRADLFLHVGLQLEMGWVPPLLRSARNSRVQPGAQGNLDASRVIPLLGVAQGEVDRSMGDVHAVGNPHYLVDPVNGIRVAHAIRDRLVSLRPEAAGGFRERCAAFERLLLEGLVGKAFMESHGAEAVAAAVLDGDAALAALPGAAPGGWLGRMRPYAGSQVVADHDLWPYFSKRFGIEVVAFLEPLPGITPTTRHLAEVAALMEERGIRVVLSASYFHPRYAEKLTAAVGGRVVPMANQVGAREGVDDYRAMIDWNVEKLADALR